MTAGRLPDQAPESMRIRILRFLEGTKATAREVADGLGLPPNHSVNAVLSSMAAYGDVLSTRERRTPTGRKVTVYQLGHTRVVSARTAKLPELVQEAIAHAEAGARSSRVCVGVMGQTVTATVRGKTRRKVATLVEVMIDIILADLPACYHRDLRMLRPCAA